MRLRFVLLTALAVAALVVPGSTLGVGNVLESHEGLEDVDHRAGKIAPTAAQLDRVRALGATARFSEFGTVQSLTKYGGYLATGLSGTPAQVARQFVSDNRVLFRLTQSGLNNLQLYSDAPLAGQNAGNVVVFKQKFGAQLALVDGLITVGVNAGKVYYASSRAAGDGNNPGGATLSAEQAWVSAAQDAGYDVSLADVDNSRTERGWRVFDVAGFGMEQRARLGSVPTPQDGVVPAYEAIVLSGGGSKGDLNVHDAYRSFVNARNGDVLVRLNIEEHADNRSEAEAFPFNGAIATPDGTCGAPHGPYVAGANVVAIDVVATSDDPTDDVVLHLAFTTPANIVQSADTGTTPEAIHYAPGGGVPPGNYFVIVCDFADGASWSDIPPNTYQGGILINDLLPGELPYPPQWKVFPAYPLLGNDQFPYAYPSTDSRQIWCWEELAGNPECELEVRNLAARAPWDYHPTTDTTTFTTLGNAAKSAESWTSPLTPGPFGFQPVAPDRNYIFPWANTWFENECATTSLIPFTEPDLPAAVTNLFAMHNRMHDWQYFLGFTEQHWNGQDNNYGNPTLQNDGLLGDAQAGALTGGAPSYLGRDNANMVPLPDGVHPITNMYLWQPIAGAFYAPCVDGDFDMAVIGHEYGHLTENRMIGKGGTRAGAHAGAMGESFGDFNAVEYLNETGFVPVSDESRFVLGAYVTGDKHQGIRNFNGGWNYAGAEPDVGTTPKINPLQFGDIGYDLTGPQVHADGEIWTATQLDIREALAAKYNGGFPEADLALQRKCAFGEFFDNPELCPGNRRWIQLYFDAMLLMPSGPSMLDARDAMLSADVNRFAGANQTELWREYARHGFGENAVSVGNSDPDPIPNHESAAQANEATVTFNLTSSNDAPVVGEVYVGWYEGNVTRIADTDPANDPGGETNLDKVAKFVPGTYELIARGNGYGEVRFRLTLNANQTRNVQVTMFKNLASTHNGATASGDGVDHVNLIDDTESTEWRDIDSPLGIAGDKVVVDLAGTDPVTIRYVSASAMVHANGDRFRGLRSFEFWTCNEGVTGPGSCALAPVNYTKQYTSPANFFPGTPPRPTSNELILRSFPIAQTDATHAMLLVLTNQCTGNTAFHGEQDADPLNPTDCNLAAAADDVIASELQVFSRRGGLGTRPRDPLVLLTKTGPATASPGQVVEYTLSYVNVGPEDAVNSKIVDVLPNQLNFVSASDGGTFKNGKITWKLGTIPALAEGDVTFTARVKRSTPVGTTVLNQADFTADNTVSPPTAKWATLIVSG